MVSETNFGHSEVVFSPPLVCEKKCSSSQSSNELIFLFWIHKVFCAVYPKIRSPTMGNFGFLYMAFRPKCSPLQLNFIFILNELDFYWEALHSYVLCTFVNVLMLHQSNLPPFLINTRQASKCTWSMKSFAVLS